MQYIDVHTHIYKPEENIISIENTCISCAAGDSARLLSFFRKSIIKSGRVNYAYVKSRSCRSIVFGNR